MPQRRSRSASAIRLLGGVVAVAGLLAVYAGMGGGAARAQQSLPMKNWRNGSPRSLGDVGWNGSTRLLVIVANAETPGPPGSLDDCPPPTPPTSTTTTPMSSTTSSTTPAATVTIYPFQPVKAGASSDSAVPRVWPRSS